MCAREGLTQGALRDRAAPMPGIDLFDWRLVPAMSEARLAGIIRFLSPCVLRGVPPHLACMPGMTMNEVADGKSGRKRVIITAVFFVMGLGTVFLILGLLHRRSERFSSPIRYCSRRYKMS